MDAIELSRTLRESARQNGLCDQWYDEWEDECTPQELVEKMYKGLDFCLKHHWPSNKFIKKNFSLKFRREVNVFVDDQYSIVNPKESLILGKSEIKARFNGASHGVIHIRDNSSLSLTAKNRSFFIVHIYDKATVVAGHSDNAHVVLITHSHYGVICADRGIRIREENDYLKK